MDQYQEGIVAPDSIRVFTGDPGVEIAVSTPIPRATPLLWEINWIGYFYNNHKF